ncbi:MAG: alpha/beta fold hydrolase [candidate division NC10 bacterium]|nr:alpha/beta fold hydrolase [candidate division NC10 bacterium]
MPFRNANGIQTYYEVAGSGEPLVLLHNDALSLEVWRRLIPHLAEERRVIAYDRRGHGQSEIPPREAPYTVEVLAEDLRGLLDGLEIPEADFFGCSGGAIAALAFALAYPERVRRLILAEPPMLGLRQEHPIDTASLRGETIARIMRERDVASGLDYWFRCVLPPARAQALLRSRYRSLLLSRPPWIIEGIVRSAEAFNPTARLAAVRQPVLLVVGQKTHRHFSSVIDVLASHLPRVRRLVLPGADHSTLLEPSEALLSAVRTFLAADDPPH